MGICHPYAGHRNLKNKHKKYKDSYIIRKLLNRLIMATIKLQAFLVLFAIAMVGNISYAAQIACDIDVSNSQAQLLINPSNDLYEFSKIDTAGDFRFSGQYLPSLHKFKTYVYHKIKNKYVLVSAQEFSDVQETCSRDFGVNRIYGGPYERELFFQCRQVCAN